MSEQRPMFLNPEAAIHGAIVQPDMTELTACGVVSNGASIFTYPLEMILEPNYGSRYFKLPIAILGTLVFPTACLFSASLGAVNGTGKSAVVVLVIFWLLWIYHAWRIGWLMADIDREFDSELDNPGWPVFPPASWLRRRGIYEPIAILVTLIVLYGVGLLNFPIMLYLAGCAFSLSVKCGAMAYAGWLFRRVKRDMLNRIPMMEQIATGTTPKDVMPQTTRHKVTTA